jgi:PAS domain S-box-containing protein
MAAGLRQPIVESWKRSLDSGLDPLDLLAPLEAHPGEMQERWAEHPLGSLAHVLLAQLADIAKESESLIVVSDASGLLLHIEGPESLRDRAAEMNFVEGAQYSETAAGTNGIGTVLAADHALQVFASEHFNQRHHGWACSAAPVHDPVSHRVLGVVDLSSPWENGEPLSLEFATAAARALEQCLADARLQSDARLRRRYAHLATRSTDLLVSPDGYVLAGERPASPPKPLTIPDGGGEVVLVDGSFAAAEPLGHGEAYLVRRTGRSVARPALQKSPERADKDVDEEANGSVQTGNVESRGPDLETGRRAARAYFEAALDCVIVADASGRVVEFNPAAERTFGYSRAEVLGRTMTELIVPPSLRERHRAAFARFIETGQGFMLGRRVELPAMRADGSEFAVELALSQVEDEPILICGALRDISPAKEAERHLRELADEQAALRRVATLVARESSPQQLFALVAEEVARIIGVPLVRLIRYKSDGSEAELIGGWGESVDPLAPGTRWRLDGPGVLASVWRSRLPARLDDYADLPGEAAGVVQQAGMRSAVASPITVEGHLWGAIAVLSPRPEPLPANTEARLADFTELVATAIANAESRAAIARLADEQAALRRVATLVARRVSPADIFSAVSEEVQRLFGLHEETSDVATVVRFDARSGFVLVGASKSIEGLPLGACWRPNDLYVSTRVHRTGRFARVDETDLVSVGGPCAETLRRQGLISQVGSPIIVEGRLWGAITLNARAELPSDTEQRLERFTDLVATAIANAESRIELAVSEGHARKLADAQAALRRVATLVAAESSPDEIFNLVVEEVGRVLGVPIVVLVRYEAGGSVIRVVAGWSDGAFPVPMGTRIALDGPSHFADVWATGRSARLDDVTDLPGEIASAMRQAEVGSGAASPILVEGRMWGAMAVGLFGFSDRLPDDIEARLADFTELVATAIANSEAREVRQRLLDEQAALRRVATMVAESATPEDVHLSVAREVAHVFGVSLVTVCRYELDAVVVLASLGAPQFPIGSSWPLDVPSLPRTIRETGRPARIDDYSTAVGLDAVARDGGVRASVGVPIVVDGSVWGSVNVATPEEAPFPADAEVRLARFTELVATAVSNATMRAEVAASRARVIAAGDETRRRIERDLHDGAQQHLVTLALKLRSTEDRLPTSLVEIRREVGSVADRLTSVIEELREMSRGIHPAILTEGGLSPAIEALALRSPIPVELNVCPERRLLEGIEVAAYYVISEALTNAAKHSQASRVQIDLRIEEDVLRLSVVDDGAGGASLSGGSGLIGLKDRVEALGGTFDVASSPGTGTRLDVEIPLLGAPSMEPLSR